MKSEYQRSACICIDVIVEERANYTVKLKKIMDIEGKSRSTKGKSSIVNRILRKKIC